MLRGVNLAAHRRIPMAPLRGIYESLGLQSPQSYINSGNVVFKTDGRDWSRLSARIEHAIERSFGFRPDVILRTAAELRDAIAANPFASRPGIDPSRLLVLFLSGDPGPEARAQVRAIQADPEELHMRGREIFIYFPNGMGRSKLSWVALADLLKMSGAGRNWNTVTKLLEIAKALEAS
ncbi:MAG: DUF1697 domain-containing protein [Acidobacteriia bacterium]|nr:DUF1697 domain-containing protein [Terriglobia bacterium]